MELLRQDFEQSPSKQVQLQLESFSKNDPIELAVCGMNSDISHEALIKYLHEKIKFLEGCGEKNFRKFKNFMH